MKNLNHSERSCSARLSGGSLSQAWQAKSFFLSFSAFALALTNSGCSTESIFSSTLKQSAPGVAAHTFQIQEDSELPNQNFDALFESGYSDELIALMRENNPDWNPETAQWNLNGVAMDGVHVGHTWVIDNSVDLTLDSIDPPRWSARPRENFNGLVTAVVRVTEGEFTSEPSTVSFNVNPVNDPPVAQTGNMNAIEDMPSTIFLTAADPDLQREGDSHTFTIETDPLHGTVMIAPNGMAVYTTDLNSNTPDSFTFRVTDSGGNSSTANVSINVTPVNDPPAAVNASISTNEETAKNGQLVATDIDSGSLTYTRITNAQHGNVTVSSTGAYTYTPALNFFGSDSFTFKANDGALDSNVATVTITVINVNDPPVAVNYNEMTNEDTVLSQAVVATDPDLDPLTYSRVSNASNGNVIMNSNGTYTYTPNQNYNGPDSFTYRATDPSNANSNTATVFITVNAVNDAPVANNQEIEVAKNTAYNGQVIATDVDHPANTLVYTLVANGLKGTASISSNGAFTYTPNNNAVGNDSFTFRATDPAGAASNVAMVSVEILDGPECGFTETFSQVESVTNKLDILFVLDTSSSMLDEIAQITEGLEDFVAGLPAGADFCVAVLLAHAYTVHKGKLYQKATEPRVLCSSSYSIAQIQTHLTTKLTNPASDGLGDGGEVHSVSMLESLTPANVTLIQSQGFYRTDAALAVVMISDEQDAALKLHNTAPFPNPFDGNNREGIIYAEYGPMGSIKQHSPEIIFNAYSALKVEKPLIMNGIGFTDPVTFYAGNHNVGENGLAHGIMEIVSLSNGVMADLASNNIAQSLSAIGELVGEEIQKLTSMSPSLVADSVVDVRRNGLSIPYSFDPMNNRISWEVSDAGVVGDEFAVEICHNDVIAQGISLADPPGTLSSQFAIDACVYSQSIDGYINNGAAPPSCGGLTATIYVNSSGIIVGGPQNGQTFTGTLNGSAAGDVIVGTNGNDIINAGAGDDTVCALEGDDTVSGEAGDDTLFGGEGENDQGGGEGNDSIIGGPGRDTLEGGNGNDLVCGGTGSDTIVGGAGLDTLFGGNGTDVVDGGADTDKAVSSEITTNVP